MDISRVDYSQVDPWVKRHPKASFNDFMGENPGFKISHWSFTKRKRFVLGLPPTRSMQSGYRPNENSLYTSVWSTPAEELKKKDGIKVVEELLDVLNKQFKLRLEPALIQQVGSREQNLEIRRYGRRMN